MKKGLSVLFLGLMLISLSVLNSCTKENLPSLTCKMDGTLWTSLVRVTTLGATDVGDGFLIVATDGTSTTDGKYLALLIRGKEVNTYNLETKLVGGQLECAAIYMPDGYGDATKTKYIGKSGTITITSIDEAKSKVSGTYSFVLQTDLAGTKKITITEGKFSNLSYLKATVPSVSVADFAALVK